MRRIVGVFGSKIDALGWSEALGRLVSWAAAGESRVVCICNAHSVVTARRDHHFREIINAADMATPDGAPVAYLLRKLGYPKQQRISGPDLMWEYCSIASGLEQSIYLYGGSKETLALLKVRLQEKFPTLKIAGALSPPYREMTVEEDRKVVDSINESGAGVVWVGLGCPKQERWMMEHRGQVRAVMVGVGAAFDYHAGTLRRAPLIMQRSGLEWLYRLVAEPRRLWRRYLFCNSLFIWYAVKQLFFSATETGSDS